MKQRERDELLRCANDTASALSFAPVDVPIEGYDAEEEQLTKYFRLVRVGRPGDTGCCSGDAEESSE